MKHNLHAAIAASVLLAAIAAGGPAMAQKQGSTLRMFGPDSPASMSILEEATVFAEGPMMGVFNNLVLFDQNVQQSGLSSIVPDLATGWSWNEEGTALTLPLRQGVKWHDGRPLTSSAPGNCSAVSQPTSCASIPANPGTKTSSRSRRTAITRSPFT
jgi:peptide/nickel transport system substrate-binding protein